MVEIGFIIFPFYSNLSFQGLRQDTNHYENRSSYFLPHESDDFGDLWFARLL
jgi:hypothetical protein